jgi:hypothetical protein
MNLLKGHSRLSIIKNKYGNLDDCFESGPPQNPHSSVLSTARHSMYTVH